MPPMATDHEPDPAPLEPTSSKAAEPKYLTWELPIDGGPLEQEAAIVREVDAKGADRITTPEVYATTKTLRRWRVRVRS